MKNSKRGARDKAVLEALAERGTPATIKEIEKILPEAFRQHMSSMEATAATCRKLLKLGKLVKWGGKKNKTFVLYGLEQHEVPENIPTPVEQQRNWVRGLYGV
jgi:hypothetical protein